MSSSLSKAALLSGFAALAAAHGTVSGIVAGGEYYEGYSPSFQYQKPAPVVVGWSIPEDLDNGFVAPDAFTSSDIICHKGATNGGTHATVAAGQSVDLQWKTWPESHHGPVIDYLANCNGPCESVDKTKLEFFKIDGVGIIDGSSTPAKFASDQLIANNNTWSVTIPSSIKAGNYVLRHEIIALHSAGDVNGAQNYPQCVNLEITGGGSDTPAGTLGTALYKADDPGIKVNIYTQLSPSDYIVPGPLLYGKGGNGETGAGSGSGTGSGSGAGSSSSSAPYTNSSTPATSAASGAQASERPSKGHGSKPASSKPSSTFVSVAQASKTAPSYEAPSATAEPTAAVSEPVQKAPTAVPVPTALPSFSLPAIPAPSQGVSGTSGQGQGQGNFDWDSFMKSMIEWCKKMSSQNQRRHAKDVFAA